MRTTHVLTAVFLCASVSAIATGARPQPVATTRRRLRAAQRWARRVIRTTEAAFQRWGGNLPLLAQENLGPYGDPASYPDATSGVAALTACQLVSENPGTPDGERAWFTTFMAELHPASTLSDFHALFDASMQVVCPELGMSARSSGTGKPDQRTRAIRWRSSSPASRPGHSRAARRRSGRSRAQLAASSRSTSGGAPAYLFSTTIPTGDYVGPSIGATYESDDVSIEDVDMMALSLCYTMLTGTSSGAITEWFDAQSGSLPRRRTR